MWEIKTKESQTNQFINQESHNPNIQYQTVLSPVANYLMLPPKFDLLIVPLLFQTRGLIKSFQVSV